MKDYKMYHGASHPVDPLQSEYDYHYHFKFHILGDVGVGKSCLLLRFVNNSYTESYISTIGTDFKVCTILYDDLTIKVQVWDTAGQERFKGLESYPVTSYGRGVMLVYDIGDRDSFDSIKTWYKELHKYGGNPSALLIGAKSDLKVSKRIVDFEMGLKLANELKIPFIETSAKTGSDVDLAFRILTSEVLKTFSKAPAPQLEHTLSVSKPKLKSVQAPFSDPLQKAKEAKFALLDSLYNEKDSVEWKKITELEYLTFSIENISEYLKKNQKELNTTIMENIKIYIKNTNEEKFSANLKLKDLQKNLLALQEEVMRSSEGFFDFGKKRSILAELTKMLDAIRETLDTDFIQKVEKINMNAKLSISKVTLLASSPPKEEKIPDQYLCLLSHKIMTDPVIVSSGQTFERSSLEIRMKQEKAILCPITREKLICDDKGQVMMFPNIALRQRIEEYNCKVKLHHPAVK